MDDSAVFAFDGTMPSRPRIRTLAWWDVLVLTIVMFGKAIWTSNSYLFTQPEIVGSAEILSFSPVDDFYAFLSEAILLSVALLYLFARRFDFTAWKFRLTWKSSMLAVALFAVCALLMDLLFSVTEGMEYLRDVVFSHGIIDVLFESTLMLVLFSFLNGFFEEIFFLGICANTDKRYRWGYFIYSVIIRISFHTYQGIVPALGIGIILGCVHWYLFTRKTDNMWTFMLAHAFADIAGLSILRLI